MPSLSNVARPYAQAVFDLAREQEDLVGWGGRLECIAAVAGNEALSGVLSTPGIDREQVAKMVIEICGDELGDEGRNLVRLLARNQRLEAAPELLTAFEALRAEAESTVEATVESALPMDEPQQQKLLEALQEHLGRAVKLEFSVNEDLIGGAVVRAGDWVVDASARAQLEQLVGALSA